ncbi:methyl-accepting chemotaxis protein [Pelagibius sp. Alg239-R121]|uniref:methyl-accepting chemotaxis protein n=1 Tax=Pelagibius sp. Alg239-R121 TaxID=2993448 RepID=UPI0024A6B820|nr:methyl-accepting chemotaxis protein [Pelagibius sp. Alg239-R121]
MNEVGDEMYKNLSIRWKMMLLVALSVIILASVNLYANFQIAAIGTELEAIAEDDLPLTSIVTKITVHQLEQAIQFERTLRFGEEMVSHPEAKDHFVHANERFHELAKQVDEEILKAEELAEESISHLTDETAKQKFVSVLASLKKLEKEHHSYDLHADEVIELLKAGDVDTARTKALAIEAEEDKFNHELEALLLDIVAFTEKSAKLAEAHEHVAERNLWIALGLGIVILVSGGLAMVEQVLRPLLRSVDAVDALADGDTTIELTLDSKDELGRLATSVEALRQALMKLNEMQAAESRRELESKAQIKKEMLTMSDALDQHVQVAVGAIRDKANNMDGLIDQMSQAAQQVSTQSTSVTASAESATGNVQTVASAAEEMSGNINEISRQIDRSTTITAQAVDVANTTTEKVQSLTEAAKQIEEIVTLINEIADQTNLLALNATIEAARAGDAGKGFAVVASEVKNLANQTAKATDQIQQQIGAIQGATGEAATAIDRIGETVNEISEITNGISDSMKEQSAATMEIARSVQEAATGTQEVSSSMQEASAASKQSEQVASEVSRDAKEVVASVNELQTQITEILRESKAGNRREFERVKQQQPSQIQVNGQWRDCTIQDISAGGAEIAALEGVGQGDAIKLKVTGFEDVDGRIIRITPKSRSITFNLDEETQEALNRHLVGERVEEEAKQPEESSAEEAASEEAAA